MKKLFMLLLTMVFAISLTGCGENKENNNEDNNQTENNQTQDVTVTKVCTTTNEISKLQQTFTYTATNGEVEKVKVVRLYDNDTLGISSFNTFTTEQKETYKQNMLNQIGLDSTSYEGLTIEFDFNDQMSITINADLKTADQEKLQIVGLDFTNSKKIDEIIEDMKTSGASCN